MSTATTPPPSGQNSQPPPTTLSSILALRLAQDHIDQAQGKPVLTGVPVEKPPKAHFFRVHSGDEHAAVFNLLDARKIGAGEGMFAVTPQIAPLVADHTRFVQVRLAVTNFGAPYLLPVPLPGPDGRTNPWHQSLTRAAKLAEARWIRISADMLRGSYSVFEALGELGEPQWPAETFDEILELAFHGRIVETEDHPLIQQLLGKV